MPSRKLETSRGTFNSVTAFAKHFGFEYDNIKKLIRDGRVEELFSGLFMGYDPTQLGINDRRIACCAIAKRVKAYAKVEDYVGTKILTASGLNPQPALITTAHEYVLATGSSVGEVILSCGIPGHPEWSIGSERLLRLRTWCGHCNKSVKKTDIQIEAELQRRGLRLISSYKNANTPILIECKNGHVATLTLSKIVNGNVGCPLCYAPREESIVRHFLEHLLGVQFDQVRKRPEWLYEISGRRLELDGFCSMHRIAFEYQGEHHYKQVGYAPSSLGEVQARDAMKAAACIAGNVRLIVVPTLPKNWRASMVGEHVTKALMLSGFSAIAPLEMVPPFVKKEPEKLNSLRIAIEAKGGTLLEAAYNGYHRLHLIRCGCSNEWGGTPASIFRGCWCPDCGRVKSQKAALITRKQTLGRNRPRIFDRLRDAVQKLGGELLESEYSGYQVRHMVKCLACEYEWAALPNTLFQGHFCIKCGQKKLLAAALLAASRRSAVKNTKARQARLLYESSMKVPDIAKIMAVSSRSIRRYLELHYDSK